MTSINTKSAALVPQAFGPKNQGQQSATADDTAAAETPKSTSAPGKSAESTAARARQILALQSSAEEQNSHPFGHTVSQVARGLLTVEGILAAQAEATAEENAPTNPVADNDGSLVVYGEPVAVAPPDDAAPGIVPAAGDALTEALVDLIDDNPEDGPVA